MTYETFPIDYACYPFHDIRIWNASVRQHVPAYGQHVQWYTKPSGLPHFIEDSIEGGRFRDELQPMEVFNALKKQA